MVINLPYYQFNRQRKICNNWEKKLYVPVVNLSIEYNAKLLEQLKSGSGFKRTIKWNKYLAKKSTERKKKCLDCLIEVSCQRIIRLFVLLLKNETNREAHIGYYLAKVEKKYYNVIIDEQTNKEWSKNIW